MKNLPGCPRVNKLITNNNACKIMIGTSVGLLIVGCCPSSFFLRKIGRIDDRTFSFLFF